MHIDKANTEEEKQSFRKEGRCFECNRQGHMARQCPNKKRNLQTSTPSFLKATNTEEGYETDYYQEDEEYGELYESTPSQEYEDNHKETVKDLALWMTKFSDEEKIEWMQAMKDNGVDFLAAWITRPWFGQCLQMMYLSRNTAQYTPPFTFICMINWPHQKHS